MPQFVQLDSSECQYLLSLIEDMDSTTRFTERQRAYTVPKLKRIAGDQHAARLAFQDVDYLLDLTEDDDLEECEQIRYMVREKLAAIQALQNARFEEVKDIETQRQMRRARRQPTRALSQHFEHTTESV